MEKTGWEQFDIKATARIVVHEKMVEIVVKYADGKTEFIPVAEAIVVNGDKEFNVREKA